MRVIALILAIVIFYDTMGTCGHHLQFVPQAESHTVCNMSTEMDHSTQKSCCSKMDHDQQKKDKKHQQKKGCCGDNCACFPCVQLDLPKTVETVLITPINAPFINRDILQQVFAISFDFKKSPIIPPRA